MDSEISTLIEQCLPGLTRGRGLWADQRLPLLRQCWFNKLKFVPHQPGQEDFHDARARFRALFAGSRFGKSMSAAREAEVLLMAGADLRPGKAVRGWLVAPTYALGEKEFRYIWEDFHEHCPHLIRRDNYNVEGGRMLMQLQDGSELMVKSCERPAQLLGEELDFIVLCEGAQIPKGVWERYLRARLGSRDGCVICPTTPKGYNWLYDVFYLPALADDPEYWAQIHSVEENPFHSRRDIEQARRTLPPEVFQEQYLGRFVAFTGLVYPEFSETEHVVKPFILPREWSRIQGLDPGLAVPFGMTWYAVQPDPPRLIQYDESYVKGLKASDQAKIIEGKERTHAIPYTESLNLTRMIADTRVIDPAASQRSLKDTRSVADELRAHSVDTVLGQNDVLAGIMRVKEYMATWADGLPGLLVFSTCKDTIRTMIRYEWGDIPIGAEHGDHPERPKKKEDHLCDCLRYVAMHMPRTELPRKPVVKEHSYAWYKQAERFHHASEQEGHGVSIFGAADSEEEDYEDD